MRFTVAEIADAVGGVIAAGGADAVRAAAAPDAVGGVIAAGGANAVVDSVTQDSREVKSATAVGGGVLFVALVAERDGHDFIAAAVAAGAVAVLSARPARELDGLAGTAVIEVAHTGAALTALGSAARARLDASAEVIGITGSVGKTTTKDLLASVMATDRPTYASRRSFNNEIGVPLTIIGAPDDTAALVVEMGARGGGHIAALCAIARPTVGVVTAVGVAHTSEFGSVDEVARAKGELIEALPPSGLAVLNAANHHVAAMASRTEARVVMFGGAEAGGADVVAENVAIDDELIPRFRLASEWGSADVVLGARGLHLVDNALAAAAVALPLGLSPDQVAAGLAAPVMSPLRMALERTAAGARILNDSYNANPMSTDAALRSLAALPATRRVAVLGVMAELGDQSAAEHARIGSLAVGLGIEVIAVAAPDYLGAVDPESPAALVADIDEAEAQLLAAGPLGPDIAVLVKGSRVASLEHLVTRLTS